MESRRGRAAGCDYLALLWLGFVLIIQTDIADCLLLLTGRVTLDLSGDGNLFSGKGVMK